MKQIFTIIVILIFFSELLYAVKPVGQEFSTAGFFKIDNVGREVFNFNVGWRFFKGAADNADKPNFNDSTWNVVNTPHGLEYLPEEASGGINYQGEAWYRKHFNLPENLKGQKIFLHFEAIMGKSKVWVNGKLLKEHFGGYLPVIIDVTKEVKFDGQENIVAVWLDNSDDPTYPPGKPQSSLDFNYFGGIYRDVWLYSTNPVHITDPNYSNKIAGGGVFVHYENLSDEMVDVVVSTEVLNETNKPKKVSVSTSILDVDGNKVGAAITDVTINAKSSNSVPQTIKIKKPHLWQPNDPYLHSLISEVVANSKIIDGMRTRIGIRKIEFRGNEGFFLNNKPFGQKLLGGNRHQDYAYIGNALSNSLHWRDVKKLRDAGMQIIRSAHYPQDPAFMDACDELGMFIIVATPGWQFWNKNDSIFGERVYSDIRNMVRRDRNHASVLMWEPILNETDYPDYFAHKVHTITHEEYPFQGCFTACDGMAEGSDVFDLKYGYSTENKNNETYFVREFGDNVDDWSSHNSNSRARISWGEQVQLVQSMHYFDALERIYKGSSQMIGGALWHPFDHNRGYHPDPFYGGIMDAFRQPKYSYYAYQSIRDPNITVTNIESGPMIYIANEMTPFSGSDVVVFTNCEEVRLTVFGKEFQTIKANESDLKLPHPPVTFKNVYTWADLKKAGSSKIKDGETIVAEGLINGKVVATVIRKPSKKEVKLILEPDFDGTHLIADGSDIVTVIAKMVDENSNVKRLAEEDIVFEVTGEGSMIAENEPWANPRKIEWGTAPCLIQSSVTAGKIIIRAHTSYQGVNTALSAQISIESIPSAIPLLFDEKASNSQSVNMVSDEKTNIVTKSLNDKIKELEFELNKMKLKEVEKQQTKFENNLK
ncbi:MAG: hypothetical protein JZU47_05535 [Prolixibacteraceae bacterium]|nr:hypothetical protein [Prolixibacteraceae bacterium]